MVGGKSTLNRLGVWLLASGFPYRSLWLDYSMSLAYLYMEGTVYYVYTGMGVT